MGQVQEVMEACDTMASDLGNVCGLDDESSSSASDVKISPPEAVVVEHTPSPPLPLAGEVPEECETKPSDLPAPLENIIPEPPILLEKTILKMSNPVMEVPPSVLPSAPGRGMISLTPDVSMSFDLKYLIRKNGNIVGYLDTLEAALKVVNVIAASEVKRLEGKNKKVFRRDLKEGREVHICVQSLGTIYNSKLNKNSVIDILPVGVLCSS